MVLPFLTAISLLIAGVQTLVVGPFATDHTGHPADHRAMRDAWLGLRVSGTEHGVGSVLSVLSVACCGSNRRATETSQAACDGVCAERRALERAAALVPLDEDVRTKLIDPELAPDPEALAHLDAFIVLEPGGTLRRVIYVNRDSAILRQAAAGSDFHVLVLAAVIHHEAWHLRGASEAEARRAECEFFRSLVAGNRALAEQGERYLRLLERSAKPPQP
jgi:hypothetical protein